MGAEAEQQRGILVSGRFPELEAALVERVRELRAGRPLVPLTVVVGSSAVRTHVGDLLVRVQIEVPTKLNAEQRAKLVEFAELCKDDNVHPEGTGFFTKAKGFFKKGD